MTEKKTREGKLLLGIDDEVYRQFKGDCYKKGVQMGKAVTALMML